VHMLRVHSRRTDKYGKAQNERDAGQKVAHETGKDCV
jgi:hypothetical protein